MDELMRWSFRWWLVGVATLFVSQWARYALGSRSWITWSLMFAAGFCVGRSCYILFFSPLRRRR